MDWIITFIKELGFPIFVAAYSLLVLNKTMKENTKGIAEITRVLSILCTKMGCEEVAEHGKLAGSSDTGSK